MEEDEDEKDSEFPLRGFKAVPSMELLGLEVKEGTARNEAKPSIIQ